MQEGPLIVLPKVMGHRGAAGLAPENTLSSIRKAAEVGVSWIEFDVKLTADNMPVIFHDDSLNRTAGRDGLMAETSADEALRLDAGSWFSMDFAGERVPSLFATLDLAQDACREIGRGTIPEKLRKRLWEGINVH